MICKLFYPQYPTKIIEHEFCNATMAWKLGIRTPKAHRLIMEDERKGIIYDRIVGEILSVKFNDQVNGYMMSGWISLLIFINS